VAARRRAATPSIFDMKALAALALLAFLAPLGECADGPLVLSARRLHLGTAGSPEWEEFARDPPLARQLNLRFRAPANSREATLFIRQDDVRQDWIVELNGRRLGKLFLMEADLVCALPVPAGALREGENLLAIVPPKENDDIVLNEIKLDPRPFNEAVHEATLAISVVRDTDRKTLPCRLTIADAHGALAPLLALTNARSRAPLIAVRTGVVYTGDGQARVGLPAGDYTIYASRGLEYGVATQHLRVARGQTRRCTLRLRHEVPTPGLVSCDPHVHTFTHSHHGDATIDERMLTLAGEGIELPIATEHNFCADYSEPARRMGVAPYFTPVTGDEVTTDTGHFNIFPVERGAPAPDFHITDWPALMKSLRATPGVRVVVLNHPRNVHNQFQPFAGTNYNRVSGENKRGPEFCFDALEVMNSSAQQSDYLLVYRDWFALLNHGYRITAVGSSDGHDVSRYIVGQGRTYIVCPDEDPGRIDVAAACSNLLAGRALVSMGLLTQMTVDDKFSVGDLATNLGPQIRVSIRVLGPSWVSATNAALYANGIKIRETGISEKAGRRATSPSNGEKAVISWSIERPAHDVHLVAIATGPAVEAPFWRIPRPYQPASPHWEGRVIGSTNPIWLDADGDGQFTSARAYAQGLIAAHGADAGRLLPALGDFDEAIATQAASLCVAAGVGLDQPDFAEALKSAAPQVQRGFAAYAATLK
jgi:hypothetical protein